MVFIDVGRKLGSNFGPVSLQPLRLNDWKKYLKIFVTYSSYEYFKLFQAETVKFLTISQHVPKCHEKQLDNHQFA